MIRIDAPRDAADLSHCSQLSLKNVMSFSSEFTHLYSLHLSFRTGYATLRSPSCGLDYRLDFLLFISCVATFVLV